MLSIMGKAQDVKIVETMLQYKIWVPRDTWAEWATSSSSKRFGWIVQVVGQRSEWHNNQWHNRPHGSESASRRVPLSRRHQRDLRAKISHCGELPFSLLPFSSASWCQAGLPTQSLRRHRFRRALRAFICTFCMRVCIYVFVCMCTDMIHVYICTCVCICTSMRL